MSTLIRLKQIESGSYLATLASGSAASMTPTGSFATTGSNTFIGNQIIKGNIFMSGSFPLIYNNDSTNNMLYGMFDGGAIYGPYYQLFGNQYPNISQRGGAEFIYDTRNNPDANFHISSFNGSSWTQKLLVNDSGAQITGSITVTNGIIGEIYATNGVISSSQQISDLGFTSGSGGGVGDENYIARFNSSNGLINSTIYQTGSYTAIRNGTSPIDPLNPDILYVDGTYVETHNILTAHGNRNNYIQINIQNDSDSIQASSDIVATADNGTEQENYIDMGINSSTYDLNNGIVGSANDAYLYSTGQDLLIGNASVNKRVIIFNGGVDTVANAKVFIHDQGTIGINTADYNVSAPPSLIVKQPNNNTTNNLISAEGDIDDFSQISNTNINAGTTASADIVAYNDIDPVNQLAGYIDMGINSTNYAYNGTYPGAEGHAYVFTDSSNLIIGSISQSADSTLTFFAGGISHEENAKLILRGGNQHELTGSISISGSQTLRGELTIQSNGTHNISGIISSSDAIHIEKNTGDLAFNTKGRILYSNYFDTLEELTGSVPSTQYHGMFTHVHSGGGRAFYSHGGFGWVQLWDKKNAAGLISGSQVPDYIIGQTIAPLSVSASTTITANTVQANSLTVSGSTDLTTYLKLNAAEDPGSGTTTSGFLFVSKSDDGVGNDLWYRNSGILYNQNWIEGLLGTGIIWGGVTTFSGSTIYITPGAGFIMDHNAVTGSHGSPQPRYVPFGPITASATYLTSSQVSYLLIDSDGGLLQQTSTFTPQQYTEKFPLGYIFNLTTSSISSYADARVTTYKQTQQNSEFVRAFGPLKISGFDIAPISGTLQINIASGETYRYGGFYTQNPESPSIYTSATIPTGSLVRVYRDPTVTGGFKAGTNNGFPFNTIDPTKYDNGSGVLQSVGDDEWTIQRVFQGVINNISYVYYGQNKYTSLALAVQSITTEQFIESPTSQLALPFIGYIIAKGNTTDLNDGTENKIIQSGLFRNTAGASGGGGAAATNINDLGDVTITSVANGEALVYNSGLWINGIPTTSSYAINSTTASYALLAENVSGIVTSASYAATASVALNAITSSYAQTISKTLQNTIPIIASAGQTVLIKNIPISKDEVGIELRTALNLSQATQCNMTTRVEQGASVYPELYFEYSTDETTWSTLNTNFVDLHYTGTQVTTKEVIPSGAKTANTYIRLITNNGTADGSSNARFGNVYLNIFTDV